MGFILEVAEHFKVWQSRVKERVWRNGGIETAGASINWYNHFGKVYYLVLNIIVCMLLPRSPFPRSISWQTGAHVPQYTFIRRFLAALFIIVQTCNQPKCRSAIKWLNKFMPWHILLQWKWMKEPSWVNIPLWMILKTSVDLHKLDKEIIISFHLCKVQKQNYIV